MAATGPDYVRVVMALAVWKIPPMCSWTARKAILAALATFPESAHERRENMPDLPIIRVQAGFVAGYGEVEPHFCLDLSVNAQLCVVFAMCRVIAAPCATESFMKLLGCLMYGSELSW